MKSANVIAQITPFRPVITRKDYKRGVLWRYFVSRANQVDMEVQEVEHINYAGYARNPTLVTEKIRWIIRGKLDDIELLLYTGRWDGQQEKIILPGVRSQNKAALEAAAENIPALKLYLTPSQYYVGE